LALLVAIDTAGVMRSVGKRSTLLGSNLPVDFRSSRDFGSIALDRPGAKTYGWAVSNRGSRVGSIRGILYP
jgi:hypothetical protein